MLYAYIDESGQRGFTDKASPHFILSAALFRSHARPYATELLAELRRRTNRQPTHELTFKRLSDEHRTLASSLLGSQGWLRVINVVACKKHLPNTLDDDDARYLLSFRYLLERISWVARRYGETAEYTLAHIRRFKLQTLRQYEADLRQQATQIDWKRLDPRGGILAQPREVAELQLADLVASMTGIAFNPPMNTSATIPHYLQSIAPLLYNHYQGPLTSYGLKMHPWNEATRAAYPWVAALSERHMP